MPPPLVKKEPVTVDVTPAKDNTQAVSSLLAKMQAESGRGFENVDSTRDLKMPFLSIVQGLSPEKDKNDPKYIEGAEEGDVFNSVSRELYKLSGPNPKPLVVIPCGFVRVWNVWRLRTLGGGFVKSYSDEKKLPATHKGSGKLESKDLLDGDETRHLEETANHSVLVLHENGSVTPAIMSMKGVQLSPSRDWLSMCDARRMCGPDGKSFRPPSYANRCNVLTASKKFSEGTCKIWIVNIAGEVNDEQFVEASNFNKATQDRLALMLPEGAEQAALPDKPVDDKY